MRQALELALEALEKLTNAAEGFSVSGVYFNEELWARKCLDDAYDAMGFAQEALAQPEQEPVAYLCENAVGHKYFRWKKPSSAYKPVALYTIPPPCPTCEALARTVMMDQTGRDA